MNTTVQNKGKNSFIRNLMDRRVPHVFIFYILLSFGVITIIRWAADNYYLSPYLEDFALLLLIMLIPVVLILAYALGIPGERKWSTLEKIAIPVNLIGAFVLLFMLFSGKDLGLTLQTIKLINEEGQIFERRVPKSEFRKSVAIFLFKNKTEIKENYWLENAVSYMITLDLSQDLFLRLTFPPYIHDAIIEAGYASGVDIPLNVRKKIAENKQFEYFLFGTVNKVDSGYTIETELFRTENNRQVSKRVFSGSDLFKLSDEIALTVKDDLQIPSKHIESSQDLPVTEIFTGSESALRNYSWAQRAMMFQRNWQDAIYFLEEAVKSDSAMAVAYFDLQYLYALANMNDRRAETVGKMMNHLDNMPERSQYLAKAAYYDFKKEPGKQLAVVKMSVDLYPDDLNSRYLLASLLEYRGRREEAINQYKTIYEKDKSISRALQSIGRLYKEMGDLKNAEKYFIRYADLFPDQSDSYLEIGKLMNTFGNYEKALEYLQKAGIIDQNKSDIILQEAMAIYMQGQFEEGINKLNQALEISKTVSDSISVFNSFSKIYEELGRPSTALRYSEEFFLLAEKYYLPAQILIQRMLKLHLYIETGRTDEAFRQIETIKSKINEPFDNFLSLGYANIYEELEDGENLMKYTKESYAIVDQFELEILRPMILNLEGKALQYMGEYEDAIGKFEEVIRLEPTDFKTYSFIGENYYYLKKYDIAAEKFKEALKIYPSDPQVNLMAAKNYFSMGDLAEAEKAAEKSLEAWSNAEDGFKLKAEAAELASLIKNNK